MVIDELVWLIALSGAGALMVTAPNSVQALEKPLFKILKKLDKSLDARKIAYYAKRRNLVEVIDLGDDRFEVRLTEDGRQRSLKAQFETMTIPRQKKWDGHWRLVVFDIPEQSKYSRTFLVEKLKSLGFFMLQRSLWVHPFPCLEQIEIIKHVLPEIAPHVALIETDTIDQHNRLVSHFTKILPL